MDFFKEINMKKTAIILMVLILNLNTCSNSKNIEKLECERMYKQTLSMINNYYTTKDKQYLEKAQCFLDSMAFCNKEIQNKITNTQISLFFLLENYDKGIVFLDSIPQNHFEKSYQKMMYLDGLKAMQLKNMQCDTIQSVKYYEKIANKINEYVSQNPNDEDALYDYFMIKINIAPKGAILDEIDKRMKLEPDKADFFKALKELVLNKGEEIVVD